MKAPNLFHQLHGDTIFQAWVRQGQPPFVRVIPKEPLGAFDLTSPMPEEVTVVTVRCWNNAGVLNYAPATPADLSVMQDWVKRQNA
jgi:hypothetical protein